MDKIMNIGLFGDSILKGVQINPINKKYYVCNNIELDMLSEKYGLQIKNYSSLGCTVTRGREVLKRRLDHVKCDAIIMDYGGNDCDYNWKAISQNPEDQHNPNTPLELFTQTYCGIIDTLKSKGILPILTTLPPLQPQKFFDWFCRDLNKNIVLKWLGEINRIYTHQENYSKAVEKIALETQVPLVDLRSAFMKHGDIDALLCEDGTHPNTLGQKIISNSLSNFAAEFLRNMSPRTLV